MTRAAAVGLAALLAACGPSDRPTGEATPSFDAYEWLADPYALARRAPGTAQLASSRVPESQAGLANEDWNHFAGERDGAHVLLSASGPGVVTRLWFTFWVPGAGFDAASADQVELRISVDGAEVSRVSLASLDAGFAGAHMPWAWSATQGSGGWVVAVPIQFQSSIELTASLPDDWLLYYQVDWRALPTDAVVRPFSGTLDTAQLALLDRAALAWTADAPGELLASEHVTAHAAVDVTGPALVRTVSLRGASLAGTVSLQIDGIDAGSGPLDRVFGADSGADGTWTLRLPFRVAESARLTIDSPVALDVAIHGDRTDDAGVGRLAFSCSSRVQPADGTETVVAMLDATRGHYAGQTLRMTAAGSGWQMLEGDHELEVDGMWTILGTGMEDYFAGGFYFHEGPFTTPLVGVSGWDLHGLPRLEDPAPVVSMYRFHALDQVDFASSLVFGWENYAGGATSDACVFYYRDE